MRSDSVAVNIFQKIFHGLVGLTDKILEWKLFIAGGAAHGYLIAGAAYMQIPVADRAGKGGLGVPWRKIAHISSCFGAI